MDSKFNSKMISEGPSSSQQASTFTTTTSHHHHHHHHHHLHHHHNYGNTVDSESQSLFPDLLNVEVLPPEEHQMTLEVFEDYKIAKKRIQDLRSANFNNNQIILFFVGSLDNNGKIWHADCNSIDRAVHYLLKKIEFGGHFLKIHVGNRIEWMGDNPWRSDKIYKITTLPTMLVCDTSKRIAGQKCFDIENLLILLKD